jgi:hypothetical protein
MYAQASSRQRVSGRLNPLSALPSPAPFWEGVWSMENLGPFLSASDVAAQLRAQGKSCGDRTPYEWARQHSISVKIGGSRLFPARFVELLLAGIPLADIPARLRERSQCATYELPKGRRPARRRSAERGARRRV